MNNKLVTETVLFNNIIRAITVVCQNSISTRQETMHFYTMWFKTVAINDNSSSLGKIQELTNHVMIFMIKYEGFNF